MKKLLCLIFLLVRAPSCLRTVRAREMGSRYSDYYKMSCWWANESTKADQVTKQWKFQVECNTLPGEVLCVTGSSDSLGHWKNEKALVLKHQNGNVWSSTSNISADTDVRYRYFVAIPVGDKLVVRRWETGMQARIVPAAAPSNTLCNEECDIEVFGQYSNSNSTVIEKGWLTIETAVQLKLLDNPIQLWDNKMKDIKMSIKVTAVPLRYEQADVEDIGDRSDLGNNTPVWPLTEISVMNDEEREFKVQNQFGREQKDNEFVVFQILTDNLESTAYIVDLYVDINSISPTHLGSCNILPSLLTAGEGQFIVPITKSNHRIPIGQITFDYLVITPLDYEGDMKITLSSQWREAWHGLNVGHRGAGESFSGIGSARVRENTIASFRSAGEAGADLVEFDVQLSKDLVPIVYHDFYVALSTQRKSGVPSGKVSEELDDVIRVPVKDLTLDEMQSLKLYNMKEGAAKLKRQFSQDLELDHQAFPTLQRAFELIDPSVGFNIELKWTMLRSDGSYELEHPVAVNIFVDTILKVVLENAGDRNCVFSCFHPDLVTMMRLKQNKYPVILLTQGVTSKWPQYKDPRCHNVSMGIHHAVSASLLGLSVHTEDLLRDITQIAQIKDAGLMVWTWGQDANEAANVVRLKELGVQAVINDKVTLQRDRNESVFLIDARGGC